MSCSKPFGILEAKLRLSDQVRHPFWFLSLSFFFYISNYLRTLMRPMTPIEANNDKQWTLTAIGGQPRGSRRKMGSIRKSQLSQYLYIMGMFCIKNRRAYPSWIITIKNIIPSIQKYTYFCKRVDGRVRQRCQVGKTSTTSTDNFDVKCTKFKFIPLTYDW